MVAFIREGEQKRVLPLSIFKPSSPPPPLFGKGLLSAVSGKQGNGNGSKPPKTNRPAKRETNAQLRLPADQASKEGVWVLFRGSANTKGSKQGQGDEGRHPK